MQPFPLCLNSRIYNIPRKGSNRYYAYYKRGMLNGGAGVCDVHGTALGYTVKIQAQYVIFTVIRGKLGNLAALSRKGGGISLVFNKGKVDISAHTLAVFNGNVHIPVLFLSENSVVSVRTDKASPQVKLAAVGAGGQIFAGAYIVADVFILVINYLVAAFLIAGVYIVTGDIHASESANSRNTHYTCKYAHILFFKMSGVFRRRKGEEKGGKKHYTPRELYGSHQLLENFLFPGENVTYQKQTDVCSNKEQVAAAELCFFQRKNAEDYKYKRQIANAVGYPRVVGGAKVKK